MPGRQWERTPIFLFGTAGLRKLPKEAQHSLLIDLRDALSQCNFRSDPQLFVRTNTPCHNTFHHVSDSVNKLPGLICRLYAELIVLVQI